MNLRTRLVVLLSGALLTLAFTAFAWHEKEHHLITTLSAQLLTEPALGLPAWFVQGIAVDAAEDCLDPDNFKHRALPQLNRAEAPEHYLDYEPLQALEKDGKLPEQRYDYYKLCYANGLDPATLGTLPWALVEWQQRLTMAFAEYRKWPNQPAIQRKALVYAGIMAHYAGDLCQPLHTTIHHDGRVRNFTDKSPRTGIHAKVDGLFRTFAYDPKVLAGATAESYDDVWAAIWKQFRQSHALVDRVYELADKLPPRNGRTENPDVIAFGNERIRASATFIASLYRTAWDQSAKVKLPDWLDREALNLTTAGKADAPAKPAEVPAPALVPE